MSLLAHGAMELRPDLIPHLVTNGWDAARAFWPGPLQRSLLVTAFVNVSAGAAASALLLTALSFAALGGIELLAVHGVTHKHKKSGTGVPARAVMRVSFLAYAVSHCIGGLAASMAIRVRLYTRRGWPITDVVKVIAASSAYAGLGLVPRKIGEYARVPLHGFSLDGQARRGLHRTRKHAIGAGCRVEFVAQPNVAPLLPTLRTISDEWLRDKHSREKCYSLGYFDADYLHHCPIAIVRCAGSAAVIAADVARLIGGGAADCCSTGRQ